ncbi:MAG: hypothetical protein IBJ11_03985 [Phycisphaerales bacterium]|nr:hypothetical protein [Phycisphaerales bacterium]
MARPVAHVRSDLALLRLAGSEGSAQWTAPVAPVGDAAGQLIALRGRASDGADWLATQRAARKGLAAVVCDVDEALCIWLKASSTAAPVLSATLRSASQDWGDSLPIGTVEPVHAPEAATGSRGLFGFGGSGPGRAPRKSASFLPVITLPDSLLRLWLDALDGRGVRVGPVMTLWHALAAAWDERAGGGADDRSVTAVIAADGERRLVWAWSDAAGLLCGGVTALEGPRPEPAAAGTAGPEAAQQPEPESDPWAVARRRLSLDWLTWASQIGRRPERLVVVGPRAQEIAGHVRSSFGSVATRTAGEADPIGATLLRLSETLERSPSPAPGDGKRALARLTARPSRALRARYRWGAAALAGLGLALAGGGWQLRRAGAAWSEAGFTLTATANKDAREVFKDLAPGLVVPQLEAKLAAEQAKPRFEPPKPPPAIFAEAVRVVGILEDPRNANARPDDGEAAGEAGTRPSIRLQRLSMDAAQNIELVVSVPDRTVTAQILTGLRGAGRHADWETSQTGDFLKPLFRGNWILKR